MKAGELNVVEFCAEHGSFRVLPFQTAVDLARQALFEQGGVHGWTIVGWSASHGSAKKMVQGMRADFKKTKIGIIDKNQFD